MQLVNKFLLTPCGVHSTGLSGCCQLLILFNPAMPWSGIISGFPAKGNSSFHLMAAAPTLLGAGPLGPPRCDGRNGRTDRNDVALRGTQSDAESQSTLARHDTGDTISLSSHAPAAAGPAGSASSLCALPALPLAAGAAAHPLSPPYSAREICVLELVWLRLVDLGNPAKPHAQPSAFAWTLDRHPLTARRCVLYGVSDNFGRGGPGGPGRAGRIWQPLLRQELRGPADGPRSAPAFASPCVAFAAYVESPRFPYLSSVAGGPWAQGTRKRQGNWPVPRPPPFVALRGVPTLSNHARPRGGGPPSVRSMALRRQRAARDGRRARRPAPEADWAPPTAFNGQSSRCLVQ